MANEAALLEQEPQTQVQEPVEQPVPSLRDSIEAAVEEHAEPPSTPQQGAKPADSPSPAAPASGQPIGEQPPKAATPPAAKGQPAAGEVQGQPQIPQELKAPAQWKPHVREKWNALPREVQEEVTRREADHMRMIGSLGPKIGLANLVANHIEPFVETLQQNQVPPQQFLGEVFGTIRTLHQGTPQQRAEVVANMVQSYGVDLRMLDAVLTRRLQLPPEYQQAQRLAAQAQGVLQQRNAEQRQFHEQQQQDAADRTLAAFGADPRNEFFEDVRGMMADLLQSGSSRNLEEAYAAAVWANPDTRKILLQREAADRAKQHQLKANQKRNIGSAVTGAPRGGSATPAIGENMSLRDTISAAIDQHTE